MRKKAKFILSLIGVLILGNYATNVINAQVDLSSQIQIELPTDELENTPENAPPLGVGLVPIEDALKQFRTSFNKSPIVPKYIPFEPTHSGGSFNERGKVVNVGYLNTNSHEFMSLMITTENFVNIKDPVYVELNDKTNAIYIHKRGTNSAFIDFIRFQKDDLTYQIGISNSKRNDGQEMLKELVKIANSL